MHFQDPALQYSFRMPLGWAYDWESSHLITVVFRFWNNRNESVSLRAMPTFASPDATLNDWHDVLEEKAFPPRMRPATRINAGSSPAALVEAHDNDPDPVHRRIMVVRGTRLDALIEHRTPEPSAGPRHSEVLRVIGESLDVPTNRFLPEPVEQDVVLKDLDLASEAVQKEAWTEAVGPALRALKAAQGMYLYTVVENTPLPEIPAILTQVHAMCRLAQATGGIPFLRNAEHLAMRALYTLKRLPFLSAERRRQVGGDLEFALEAVADLQLAIVKPDGDASGIHPSPGIGLAHLRSDYLDEQAREAQQAGSLNAALMLSETAVADLLMVASELPQRMDAFDENRVAPDFATQLRAAGAETPEEMKELSLKLVTRTKMDDLTRSMRLLADLRLLADDFVGAAEATDFVMPILEQLEKPMEVSFGGHISPFQDSPAQRAMALMAHASSLSDIGDPASLAEAHHILDEANGILDYLNDEGAMRAQLCLARASVLHSERRLEGALETIEQGLSAAEQQPEATGAIVQELKTIKSQFLLNAGEFAEAKRVAQKVIESPEEDSPRAVRRRSSHYLNLAIIELQMGEFDEASENLKQALDRAVRAAPYSESAYRILMVSSRLFNDAPGSLKEAELANRLNLAALANLDGRYAQISSDSARIGFDETGLHRQSYADMIERLIAVDDWEEAASIADRSRARSLNRLIAPPSGDGYASHVEYRDPPRLAGMEIKGAFRKGSDYIIEDADALISRQGMFQSLNAEGIKQVVRDTGAPCLLIQPVNGRVALIVVRPDGQVQGTYSPNSASEIQIATQMVQQHIGLAGSAGPAQAEDELNEWLNALWLSLIAPVSGLLDDEEPLMIAPYREFTLVPFALLLDRNGDSLIDHRPIALTPSLATLGGLRAKGVWERLRPQRAYIAGDPAFQSKFKMDRLPGAKAEAEAVAGILGEFIAADGELLLRVESDAHEESYRREARGCDLVHLACHAQLVEPAYKSRLVLAPYERQDGLLMAEEATDVKLNDALVFLGACQTGRGRVTADGVVGLGRSFMEAGARAVVLSLWNVQDEATGALTTHFYENLVDQRAQPSAAKALQQAMLKTRDDLRANRIAVNGEPLGDHPRYWAPFFILGDAFKVRYAP